jgi:hypothetical protein
MLVCEATCFRDTNNRKKYSVRDEDPSESKSRRKRCSVPEEEVYVARYSMIDVRSSDERRDE